MAMAFRGLGRPTDELNISIAPQPPEAQGTFAPMPPVAPPPAKGGFFGQGGAGRAIAGYLGDAMAQMGGVRPVYAQAVEAQREREQYQRQLQDRWDMWKRQQDYENANKPVAYTDFQKNMVAAGIVPGSQEWRTLSLQNAQNTADPIVNGTLGGRDFVMPRSVLLDDIGMGGDRKSPTTGGTTDGDTPPDAGKFYEPSGARSLVKSMGAQGWLAHQRKYGDPVLVRSREDAAGLPSGTKIKSPDGRIGVIP